MPVTELATIPLVAGSQLGDPDNSSAAVFKDCATTISQQDGYHQMQFGVGLESPGTLQMAIGLSIQSNLVRYATMLTPSRLDRQEQA